MAVDKKKKYILVEFPYPSGSGLHVGHAFSFTGADVYARYQRMKGYEVLFPMGWDAFGLPTENYAIKMKRKPQEVTKENTDMFRSQMKRLGFSFDWEREVDTTDPKYYKWTQWIFIQLFKKGLAYKKEMPINWCPKCRIGLANEEVVNGSCERCGAEVSRRNISQWVVKITEYADKLIDGLEKTKFIDKVKQAQINWIGKSEGAKIRFKIVGGGELEVFTTRPDTLPGVTFMVIAPEHELSLALAKSNNEIERYIEESRKKSDLERTELTKEKTGVFSGLYAINPVNDKQIPIWISDFVLNSYGTGAIMAVPAHDDRDHAFAKKFGLPIVPVIKKSGWNFEKEALTEVKKGEEFEKMLKWIEDKVVGERSSSYHLRDWIFSRQHYWGEPIPMINCSRCGWQPVPEEQLPVVLPEVEAYEPTDDGQSPLAKMTDWVETICPKCGGKAKRETDTMPNWAGSDWYFLRYIDPFNEKALANMELMKKWLPVDTYIGGDEHNTLHLLYSRFIYKFLFDIKAVPETIPEPYMVRLSHGVILGPDNQRMSKSKGNVIVPETVVDKHGVDVLRMYLMFMGPFDGVMAWNEKTLVGVKRFLERIKKIEIDNKKLTDEALINKLINQVEADMEGFRFNTAVAKIMKATNSLKTINRKEAVVLLKLLRPFVPFLVEEIWNKWGEGDVDQMVWPEVDSKWLVDDEIIVPVAVNGKVRDQLILESNLVDEEKEILIQAKSLARIEKMIAGKDIIREIYIKGKMVNLVVKA